MQYLRDTIEAKKRKHAILSGEGSGIEALDTDILIGKWLLQQSLYNLLQSFAQCYTVLLPAYCSTQFND